MQTINLINSPQEDLGDFLRNAFTTINANFIENDVTDASAIYNKASYTYVDASLNAKANLTYVDASLNAKADKSYYKYLNRNADFTFDVSANTKIENIDAKYILGSPVFKVGTVSGSDNLVSERTLAASTSAAVNYIFDASATVYVGISDGSVSVLVRRYSYDINTI